MALSNWDLLAIGKDGKSCDGTVKGKFASLEIYKNWAYLSSEEMYREGGHFSKPVIGSIISGDFEIAGLSIVAIRHSLQNSIFVFVDASTYNKNNKQIPNYFAGIGCYAFYSKVREYLDWKGINIEFNDVITGSRKYTIGPNDETILLEKTVQTIMFVDENDEYIKEIEVDEEFGELTDFVGVMPETLEAFKNWLLKDISKEYEYTPAFKKWINSIDWESLYRFNQGDRFFVGHKQSGTKVGEQNDTIITKMTKK